MNTHKVCDNKMKRRFKPNKADRFREATEQYNKSGTPFDYRFEKTIQTINKALARISQLKGYNDVKIECDGISEVLFDEDTIKTLMHEEQEKHKKFAESELFFVAFSNLGDVVVVGAGYDMLGLFSKQNMNQRILKELGLEWGEKAIIIKIHGLKPSDGHEDVGNKGCDHILQCRNGVETYIGECLIDNGIGILNRYSHWNYIGLNKNDWTNEVRNIFTKYSEEMNDIVN